ncbi:hypothetical protein NGRA_3035 [Nosema granulosis]|uniref:Uncharacterized protein n=1 Tax=Nosema granulosis TaxID=83296 RepID=A0A9P6GWZ2_9MICR|nr:hypothetical protein NGRA_3035 [Nosema granulosis]
MFKIYLLITVVSSIAVMVIIFFIVKKFLEKNDKETESTITICSNEDESSLQTPSSSQKAKSTGKPKKTEPSGASQQSPVSKQNHFASLDDNKKLFADARQWEINLIKGKYNIPCEKLNYSTITKIDKNKNDQLKNVEFREDGIAETFRLAKIYNQVASVSAANEFYIGGSFSVPPNDFSGRVTQEGALMSVTSGLMASLFQFATVSKLQYDSNRVLQFETNTFKDNILFSENLQPKIEMKTYDDYCTNHEGYKFFSDYVADKNAKKKILNTDLNYIFHIYSIANKDRRSLVTVDYQNIEDNTFKMISTMLIHAASKAIKGVVITIPGSGIFSKDSTGKVDTNYLDSIEKGTILAIKMYGKPFDKIVVCGHRKETLKPLLENIE